MMMNLFVHKKVVGTIIQIIVQQQITPLILIMAFIKILIQVALSARENVVNISNAGPLNVGVNKRVKISNVKLVSLYKYKKVGTT